MSLSGYSFISRTAEGEVRSPWLAPDRLFTTVEFQKRYDRVEISLMTPKAALVPAPFFDPSGVRAALAEVVSLRDSDAVEWVEVPSCGAVMLYSNSIDESLSSVISGTVLDSGGHASKVYPELYWMIRSLDGCGEYNKIIASYMDGWLHLVVAQGRTLLLANVYEAADFTTAEYFIFLALKSLQLNPEISSISFRTPLAPEQEMSLYRYFKSVEVV